jgi:hypothetical protein
VVGVHIWKLWTTFLNNHVSIWELRSFAAAHVTFLCQFVFSCGCSVSASVSPKKMSAGFR